MGRLVGLDSCPLLTPHLGPCPVTGLGSIFPVVLMTWKSAGSRQRSESFLRDPELDMPLSGPWVFIYNTMEWICQEEPMGKGLAEGQRHPFVSAATVNCTDFLVVLGPELKRSKVSTLYSKSETSSLRDNARGKGMALEKTGNHLSYNSELSS